MRTRTLTTLAATAAAALVVTGCSGPEATPSTSDSTSTSSASSASASFNDADVAYARGMSMHHQQAVEMADILLAKDGVDSRVAKLARQIKKAQQPEIRQMSSWLDRWGVGQGGGHGAGHGGMDHGGDDMGMVSKQDIAKLEAADGPQGSRLFLDQMIEHHEGAVDMARDHVKHGKDAQALRLSRTVIKDQQAEIREMRDLRAAL